MKRNDRASMSIQNFFKPGGGNRQVLSWWLMSIDVVLIRLVEHAVQTIKAEIMYRTVHLNSIYLNIIMFVILCFILWCICLNVVLLLFMFMLHV